MFHRQKERSSRNTSCVLTLLILLLRRQRKRASQKRHVCSQPKSLPPFLRYKIHGLFHSITNILISCFIYGQKDIFILSYLITINSVQSAIEIHMHCSHAKYLQQQNKRYPVHKISINRFVNEDLWLLMKRNNLFTVFFFIILQAGTD